MNWGNLKFVECPKCGHTLTSAPLGYRCTNSDCEFRISHDKFQSVVNNMYKEGKRMKYDPETIDRSGWE